MVCKQGHLHQSTGRYWRFWIGYKNDTTYLFFLYVGCVGTALWTLKITCINVVQVIDVQ